VTRQRRGVYKTSLGRGFSEAELKEVGLSLTEARRMRLRTDSKRHAKRDENVKVLKAWLECRKKATAP